MQEKHIEGRKGKDSGSHRVQVQAGFHPLLGVVVLVHQSHDVQRVQRVDDGGSSQATWRKNTNTHCCQDPGEPLEPHYVQPYTKNK